MGDEKGKTLSRRQLRRLRRQLIVAKTGVMLTYFGPLVTLAVTHEGMVNVCESVS